MRILRPCARWRARLKPVPAMPKHWPSCGPMHARLSMGVSKRSRLVLDAPVDDTLRRIDPARDLPTLPKDVTGAAPIHEQRDHQLLCGSCGGAGWVKEAVPY